MSLIDPILEPMLDQNVTINGTARIAMLGAVILTDDRTPVYVDGIERWDNNTDGRSIAASGLLVRKKLAPDPVVDADGGHSHGIEGTQYVLESANWSLAS